MSEEKKDKETDFSEYARDRPNASPPDGDGEPERGKEHDGSGILRGCAIAFGIAGLIFFLIVGACFIGLSR